jgi:hypothetical protein
MKVNQINVESNMKISDLINQFDESGVLGAGRVARACNILADMIQDEDMSVFMSLGGPLIPGGMRHESKKEYQTAGAVLSAGVAVHQRRGGRCREQRQLRPRSYLGPY